MHLKPFGHVEPLMEHGPNILLEGEMIKEREKDLQKLIIIWLSGREWNAWDSI